MTALRSSWSCSRPSLTASAPCVDGVRALGQDGSLRLESAIEAFTAFLGPGFEAKAETPLFHGNLIGSTVVHVITQHVREDRVEQLPRPCRSCSASRSCRSATRAPSTRC